MTVDGRALVLHGCRFERQGMKVRKGKRSEQEILVALRDAGIAPHPLGGSAAGRSSFTAEEVGLGFAQFSIAANLRQPANGSGFSIYLGRRPASPPGLLSIYNQNLSRNLIV